MDIKIPLITGHPYRISARSVIRSLQELEGFADVPIGNGEENVQLMHPPVLLLQEGGGESLLNRDSVISQLSFYKNQRKNDMHMPKSLVVNIIDGKKFSSDFFILFGFAFGPLQRMFHGKKDGDEEHTWRKAIKEINEDPPLKFSIEKILFNGDELSVRHYKKLFYGANLSESTLGRDPGIVKQKRTKAKDNKNIDAKTCEITLSEEPTTDEPTTDEPTTEDHVSEESSPPHGIEEKIPEEKSDISFNLKTSLERLKKESDRGVSQLSLNMEVDK